MLLVAISIVVQLYSLVLIARIILDYVRMFARQWTPRGVSLFLAEGIYMVTDPVVNFVRRFIKPIRIGQVGIDISFIVIFLMLQLLLRVVSVFL
jgi:YggT family protein